MLMFEGVKGSSLEMPNSYGGDMKIIIDNNKYELWHNKLFSLHFHQSIEYSPVILFWMLAGGGVWIIAFIITHTHH